MTTRNDLRTIPCVCGEKHTLTHADSLKIIRETVAGNMHTVTAEGIEMHCLVTGDRVPKFIRELIGA